MNLFLDIGNTAIKWRARDADRVLHGGARHGRDWPALLQTMLDGLPEVAAVWVASVAGKQADQQIADCLSARLGLRPNFYYSPAADAGVRNAYQQPATLGVDRWLAIVEAYHRFGAAIVIDCGSAMTVDVVDAAGQHRGGYIVPGLAMAREALLRDTAAVKFSFAQTRPGLGASTGECVNAGVLAMLRALVMNVVAEINTGLEGYQLVIAGGDAALLAAELPVSHCCVPDLVLDGLERIAQPDHAVRL